MPRLSELKYKYITQLTNSKIEREEAIAEFELVVKKCCGFSAKDILMDKNVTPEEEKRIERIIHERIETKKPVQRILGEAHFMGDEYLINEHTLIPRPETELLVAEAVKILKTMKNPTVLDIGTGTGCIACAVAKNCSAEVIGVDISTDALQVALKNADRLDVIKKAMFRKSDIFSNVSEKFDIIVSNPPYIPRQNKAELQPEVRDFEPEMALFTDDEDGLEYYKNIISKAPKHLNHKGYLLFELGAGQADSVKKLLIKHGFNIINTVKDFQNIERVVVAQIN